MLFQSLLMTFFLFIATSQSFAKEVIEKFTFHQIQIQIKKEYFEKNASEAEAQGPHLTVRTLRKKKLIDEVAFKNVEAVGGTSDVIPLRKQPLSDFFILSKTGDYNDRLLLITKEGKILNVPDGHIFKGKKYLHFYREDVGPQTPESVRLNLKDPILETDSMKFPEDLKSMKALDRKKFKWVPAEDLLVIDEDSGKEMTLKKYIQMRSQ